MKLQHLIITCCFLLALLSPTFPQTNRVKDSLLTILNSNIINAHEEYALLCELAYTENDGDSIIFYSNKALEIAKEQNISPSNALIRKGNGYLYLGKLIEALNIFLEAAKIDEDNKNYNGLAIIYLYISDTYGLQQDYDNAINYLQRALIIFNDGSAPSKYSATLLNLGFQYYKNHNYDSALKYMSLAKDQYTALNHKQGIAYSLGNSGLVHSKLESLDSAQIYLMQGIKVLEELGDEYGVTDFMTEYAYVLQRKDQLDVALKVANSSMRIAEKNNNVEQMRDAALRLSQIYANLNLHHAAYTFQSKYYALADSIKNLNAIQQMANIRTEFEVAQKQVEVDSLRKTKKHQLVTIIALIIGIVIAAGFISLYYTSLVRSRRLSSLLDKRMKELNKQREELEKLNNIKDRFFSIISHDLRGPISSLGGISIMFQEDLLQDNKDISGDIIDYIDNTVVSLSSLLDNLLNWAVSQQGKFPFSETKLDTKYLVEEAIKMYSTIILAKDINIRLNLIEEAHILGDENMLLTIFRNLVSNAVKYTKTGGYIEIASQIKMADKVEILVTDNGVGIPEDKLNSLFVLSENKSTRGTKQEKGLGLGLSLIDDFVKQNNGEIHVESRVGEGTTFRMTFPIT